MTVGESQPVSGMGYLPRFKNQKKKDSIANFKGMCGNDKEMSTGNCLVNSKAVSQQGRAYTPHRQMFLFLAAGGGEGWGCGGETRPVHPFPVRGSWEGTVFVGTR